jgi:hypothetical protein
LDGEEWEVIEADASSGLVKYARFFEGDAEHKISLGELEEATLDEASALRARESVEATALEVDALIRQEDEAVAVVEYSPDPDVRLIRNIWARKGGLERVRGVKFMWLHRRFGRPDSSSSSCCTGTDETPWHVIGECNDADAVGTRTCCGPIGCGMCCKRRPRGTEGEDGVACGRGECCTVGVEGGC